MVFLLLLETGMIGVFCALDLVLFYFFWEAMLIPMYFLIGIFGHERRSTRRSSSSSTPLSAASLCSSRSWRSTRLRASFDVLALSNQGSGPPDTRCQL